MPAGAGSIATHDLAGAEAGIANRTGTYVVLEKAEPGIFRSSLPVAMAMNLNFLALSAYSCRRESTTANGTMMPEFVLNIMFAKYGIFVVVFFNNCAVHRRAHVI